MPANRYHALRKVMWAMFALTSVALVAAAAWVIRLNTEVLERRIEREALNLRTLLIDQMGRSVSALDTFLEDSAPSVAAAKAQAGALAAVMRRAPSSHAHTLLVLDSHGRIVSGTGRLGESSSREIPAWAAQRADSPAGTHISSPIEWPEGGKPQVVVSRPLEAGRLGQYLGAVVDLGFFGEMFTRLDVGGQSGWFIAIIRGRRAWQLARYPDYPGAAGREIEVSESRLKAINEGVMPLPMPGQFTVDGVERLLYYGRLRDQPLYAGIGLSRSAIREEILNNGLRNGGLAALALLVVTLLFWSLLRQVRVAEAKEVAESEARERSERADEALRETHERYQQLFEAVPLPIFVRDTRTLELLEFNQATVDTYGYTREELAKMTAQELLPPEDRDSYLAEMARRPAEGRVGAARTHLTKSGRRLAVEVSAQPLLYGSRPARLVVARDVTSELEAKLAIRTSEERLRGTLDNTPGVAVQWFDRDGRIQYWNAASERLYGVPAARAVGRSFTEIGVHTPEQNREFLDFIAGIERSGSPHGPDELTIRTPRGAEVTVLYTMFMIPGISGGNTFVRMDVDLTERKRAEERIQYLATRDGLTGLPNRLLVSDRLVQAIAACKREGRQLAVLFMDIDRFKLVNDTLGHGVGDRLLREVAARIGASTREEDTLARLGGDEFVLVACGLRSSDAAAGIAAKILAAVATPFAVDGHSINVAVSIGISVHPADAPDVQGLLRNADIAMYHAKDHGGGRYEFYSDEMNARVVERQRIEGKLRSAVEKDALFLVYQPKVDIRSGRVTGAEALLRWDDPDLGPVSPLRFIGIAEETGLIVPLGRWVMRTAFRQLAAWLQRGWPFPVAVNLSVRQFTEGLVEEVERLLLEARLDPQWIELEITENVFLTGVDNNMKIVERLSQLGVAVTLDDFGTGYSSFSYLKRFAVSGLKIDQSFVRDVTQTQDASIVGAIIGMAHNLGMKAVAEGVETREQLNVLKDLGCDEYQGYLFSRPLRVPQFEALLERSGVRRPDRSRRGPRQLQK